MRYTDPYLLTVAILSLAAVTTAAPAAPLDKDDPAAELQSFRVADGYEVSLFASEKEGIIKPVQMRWDAQGRLWVSCIPSYPQPRPEETPDDRIVVLEDRAHSGHADHSTVFARGLLMPLGLEVGNGGAYVTNGNDLVHLTDSTGGLHADRQTPVLRGFFTGDSHQDINSFIWGPGGELMFCQGLHAFSRIETPYGIERLDKAGVWRYRPRSGRLDPFLGWDRGPQNPWGLVFDDWGQCIMVAGNGQGIYYMLPAMIRTQHFLDPRQISDTRNIKFCGVDIIGTRAMPDSAQGLMVAPSILNNSVYWFKLNDDGSGFHAKDLPPLIVSTHPSFRGVDAKVGPDGAIYICDWYNPIIGHYQASLHHPDRDHSHGRIWRIAARGKQPVIQPDLAHLSISDLIEQLRSPERWTRYQTKRVLAEKGDKEVCDALGAWIGRLDPNDPKCEHLLYEALGIYEAHEVVEPALLARVLRASDYRARAYAAGVITHWHDRLTDPLALLARAAADEEPRVRLAAIVAASYIPSSHAMETALIATDQPMDRFLNEALIQATAALKPYWQPALEAGQLSFDKHPTRLAALTRADGSSDILHSLSGLLRDGKLSGDSRDSAVALMAEAGNADEITWLLADAKITADPQLLSRAIQGIAQNYRLHKTAPAGDRAAILTPLLNSTSVEVRRGALTLAGLWHLETLRQRVEAVARDPNAPEPLRRSAIEALAELGGASSISSLSDIASTGASRSRAVATIALARLDLPKAAHLAAAQLSSDAGAGEAAVLIPSFLTRQGGADALAGALADVTLPRDRAKLALRAVSSVGGEAGRLREVLGKAAGTSAGKLEYDAQLVRSLAAEALKAGNPAAGERVFRGQLTNCLACHSIGGAGGRVGPDLAPVGTALPVDLVVESVLWPQRQIKEGYTATMVQTKDGDVLQGYRVSEDKNEYVLREPSTGKPIHIPSANIKVKRDIGSLMPDGLTDGLTHQELVDLIRFLSELGKPGPYRVSAAPLVRVWETAGSAAPSSEPPHSADWTMHYSLTNGELPLAEIAPAEGNTWARCKIDVMKPGQFSIKMKGAAAKVWLDGKAIPAGDLGQLELGTGQHSIVLGIEHNAPAASALSCEITPAPQTGGEIRLPGN